MQKIKLAALAAFMVVSASVRAQDMEPQPGYGYAPTVKELLQIDAKKAREAALGEDSSTAQQPSKPLEPIKPRPALHLAGVYGHAGQWKAEVSIDGQPYEFSAGQVYSGFKAKRITGNCIELQHPKFAQKLCTRGQ